MNTESIKIAFVTDNHSTISQHFGRALFYEVLTLENNMVSHRETRDKPGHLQFSGETHHHQQSEQGHGFDAPAKQRHGQMLEVIKDCAVLVARGMGAGAYTHLNEAGIRPFITDIISIDDAVEAWLNGNLVDHPERLH